MQTFDRFKHFSVLHTAPMQLRP